ncbi:dermonecrotic toxin domain-containing protein [Pseudomonas sp. Z4-20]|uniref:dermonecrotic toxin domain-containing protein n=1 Tax=Pseudomonas sp. Z4-20 TaxID=2817414 RepID=UPI003DA89FB8
MPISSGNGPDTLSLPHVSQLPALGQTSDLSSPPQEKAQATLLGLLDINQAELTRLFAGLPTFDTALKNLMVNTIKAKIPENKFRALLLEQIDPDHGYVNHYSTESDGARSLTASKSFSEVMWGGLSTGLPPNYTGKSLGFFIRPDSVDERDSIFVDPVDTQISKAMETALYIENPTTNDRIKQQFRQELALFRSQKYEGGSLGTTTSLTVETAFAHLLSQRFLHLFDLYKVDRDADGQTRGNASARDADEDRLLDIITTHPSKLDRSRLMRDPIPQVYCVMLDGEANALQKWPAAMVIKRADREALFLYSLESGLQRFSSFKELVNKVQPVYKEHQRTIRNISSELSGHVFDVAAEDLLHLQRAALEAALGAPENKMIAVRAFANKLEAALLLPMLSLLGPLLFRAATTIENKRPNFYKTATPLEQAHYRRLEERVMDAASRLAGGVQGLEQFAREKIKDYLHQTVHLDIKPDPDKTTITLFSGTSPDPRNSRVTSLTQLMLDNVRPLHYPNAMRELLPVYLVDRDSQRISHPVAGSPITLKGDELAKMATTLDIGGNYEIQLQNELNKPAYKSAWQTAYLANLKFKRYEATLKGSEVFKVEVLDKSLKPPKSRKLLALWLNAILKSPTAAGRGLVCERRVHVFGLLLGGSVGIGGQDGTMGNAASIDGALIFSDQEGPVIKGTVGVYLPDGPEGNDLHEFSDLSDGITALLQQAAWQKYFRSRISSVDEEEIKDLLGQHRRRPLIRVVLMTGDFLKTFHQAHVNFHKAYADHRSTSNRDIQRQTALRLGMMAVEAIMDVVGLLFTPGFRLLKSAVDIGYRAFRTGIPMDLKTLIRVHNLVSRRGRRSVREVILALEGQGFSLNMAARQAQGDVFAGLPLEETLYRRYAVSDASLLQGVSADTHGFYRPTVTDSVTGSVTRPVYVRQADGTVFRVHDHTRLNAIEATLVDPVTGLSIRSSGVMRSTVARMPDGEWRAVGFGRGGGKRSGDTPPQPGSSKPKVPALSRMSDSIRTPGSWDNEIMDLVPAIMTRLERWPQNRSLLIRDETSAENYWSVRFTPGQNERIYPLRLHPDASANDVVLSRVGSNHYRLILNDRVVDIPADGDCFFNAVAQGLNEGQAQGTFSVQGLRNEAADYIDQHPELRQYLPAREGPGVQLALFHNAPALKNMLDIDAFTELTRIIHGAPNPHGLFQPALNYLDLIVSRVGRETLYRAENARLPAEIFQLIGRELSPHSPGRLRRWYGPLSLEEQQSLQNTLESILLAPVESGYLTAVLEHDHLILGADQFHIMLEYGVTAQELSWNHPHSEDFFAMFDPATHGQLDEDQLDELGVSLVSSEELEALAQRLKQATGYVLEDEEQLLSAYIDDNNADRTRSLYRGALGRFPELQRRARILLRSSVIEWTLGDQLRVSLFASWLRNPALSDERLRLIAAYASTRYRELLFDHDLDISWMQPFDDQNVQSFITHQEELRAFRTFLLGADDEEDIFSVSKQMPSNIRIRLLFNTPDLWNSLQRFPLDQARQVWGDLVGPHFSDTHIRLALERPDALRSELDFALALQASLGQEEARANRIIQGLFGFGQRRAQQYLYNFEFPSQRLGHSRLDFALHLESHLQIPDWAWQYAREGVTPDSLKSFGIMKAAKPSEDKIN